MPDVLLSRHDQSSPTKILLDRRSAATALSISLRELDYQIQRGELRAHRCGRRVLLHVRDLEAWAHRDHPAAVTPNSGKGGAR